jgi:hypothetical protein
MKKTTPFRFGSAVKRRENTALGWLGNDAQGAGVLETVRRHLQIEQVMATVLPSGMETVCRVIKLDGVRLQVAVPSAAHAAKLRQLGPRIGHALTGRGWNVTEIDVKVQAGIRDIGAKKPRPAKEAVPLGESALQAFQDLHDNVRPGTLADAIAKLLAHHKG